LLGLNFLKFQFKNQNIFALLSGPLQTNAEECVTKLLMCKIIYAYNCSSVHAACGR